jgi:hypothetical protein
MRRSAVVLGAIVLAVVAAFLAPAQRGTAATQTVHFIVTGAGPGGGPQVRVFGTDGSATTVTFFAYSEGFSGGVHVATGDLNNDGVDEIITGAGPGGGPQVRTFLAQGGADAGVGFFAYPLGFGGGVNVAGGKLKVAGSRVPMIVTGPGPGGGPQVRVFKVDPTSKAVTPFASFDAYAPSFSGGVSVAAADLDNDGTDEIITGAGPGGGPHVRVFRIDPNTGTITPTASFFPYAPAFGGGVDVAGGSEIVTGAGPGGGPHVRNFDGTGTPGLASFFAYPTGFGGGVHVAAGDLAGNSTEKIVTGAGPSGGPQVRVFDNDGTPTATSFFAYPEGFGGGVYVAVGSATFTLPTTTTTTAPCATTTSSTGATTTSTACVTTTTAASSSTTSAASSTSTTGSSTTSTTAGGVGGLPLPRTG